MNDDRHLNAIKAKAAAGAIALTIATVDSTLEYTACIVESYVEFARSPHAKQQLEQIAAVIRRGLQA